MISKTAVASAGGSRKKRTPPSRDAGFAWSTGKIDRRIAQHGGRQQQPRVL